MRSRTATALVGFAASLLVSAAAWYLYDTFLLFLVVPFVPFLLRRGRVEDDWAVRACPACGFETREPGFEYCPRDGTRLEPGDRPG